MIHAKRFLFGLAAMAIVSAIFILFGALVVGLFIVLEAIIETLFATAQIILRADSIVKMSFMGFLALLAVPVYIFGNVLEDEFNKMIVLINKELAPLESVKPDHMFDKEK